MSKKPKKAERKQWWTVAHLNREGQPVPEYNNFAQRYNTDRVLLEDLMLIRFTHTTKSIGERCHAQ